MQFLKDLLRNLVILIGLMIAVYFFAPGVMKQVFELYGALFGPLVIVMLVVFALPRKKGQGKSGKSIYLNMNTQCTSDTSQTLLINNHANSFAGV